MRPKVYNPENGKGGGRQSMWNLLRRGEAVSIGQLIAHSGSQNTSVRSYMNALVTSGHVERIEDGVFQIVRNTGPRAPSANATTGTVYDWNINPPMTGAQLKAAWQKSGLSVAAWAKEVGLGLYGGRPGETGPSAHHLIEMFDGKRPVSPAIEAKILAYEDAHK